MAATLALAVPQAAIAQRIDLPGPIGNDVGGQPFRHECAPGFYLVGLNVRDGAWIDAIGAVCQRWNPAAQKFEGTDQTFDVAGGGGGSAAVIRCQPNAAISSGVGQGGLNEDGGLARLVVGCRRVDMPDQANQAPLAGREAFGKTHGSVRISGTFSRPVRVLECPPGFWSVGIFGRAGKYVDRFGMICGKGPARAAPPAPPPAAIQRVTPRSMISPSPAPGGRALPSLNPATRQLGCPAGTQPRTDEKGALVCVRP